MDLYAGADGSLSVIKTLYDDWLSFATKFSNRVACSVIIENRWSSYEFSEAKDWKLVYSRLYEQDRVAR
jgi:hypothetical protein